MGSEQVKCDNCGALMTPQADGRTYACGYCSAKIQVAIDAKQIAAGMRLDLANVDAFLLELATAMSSGFAERTRVQSDAGRVVLLEVNLDPDMFVARREPHGVVVQHKKMVRGIALKTKTHPLDRWVEMLTTALAAHANTSAHAAQVHALLANVNLRRG